MSNVKEKDMTTGSPMKLILAFAIPMANLRKVVYTPHVYVIALDIQKILTNMFEKFNDC